MPARLSTFLLAFLAALAVLLAGPLPGGTIEAIRSAQHDGFARVVVETPHTEGYRLGNYSGDLGVVTVELPAVSAAAAVPALEKGLLYVTSARSELTPAGRLRLHFRTDRAVRVEDQVVDSPRRLVLDFFPADGGLRREVLGRDVVEPLFSNDPDPTPPPPAAQGPKRRKVIVIDPGHGGHHKGGGGRFNGRQWWEKEVVLAVGLHLERLLKADGRYDIRLTRRDDRFLSLSDRVRLAAEFQGDLFISIHTNAVVGAEAQARARGLEFWLWNRTGSNSAAARELERLENDDGSVSNAKPLLNQMMTDALEMEALRSRPVAEALERSFMKHPYFRANYRGIESARFKVLENYNMPSVLVELGFLTHPEEGRRLIDPMFQRVMAERLAEGILAYMEAEERAERAARETAQPVTRR